MLARHGWKRNPTPRRGFTVVEASREAVGAPVVVALHDADRAVHLFRSAVEESMGRLCDLVVLDFGENSLREQLVSTSAPTRELNELRAFCANPHVRLIRQHPADASVERTVSYCESIGACLLILGADFASSAAMDTALAGRLFRGAFDLLIVTEEQDSRDLSASQG